jgi:hypothetical protein
LREKAILLCCWRVADGAGAGSDWGVSLLVNIKTVTHTYIHLAYMLVRDTSIHTFINIYMHTCTYTYEYYAIDLKLDKTRGKTIKYHRKV